MDKHWIQFRKVCVEWKIMDGYVVMDIPSNGN